LIFPKGGNKMRKTIFLITLLVLAIFIAGCKEQAGEAFMAPIKTRTITPPIDTTPPGPVSNLGEVSPTGCDTITWNWRNPVDADLYRLEVRVGSLPAKTLANTVTSYTQTGLTRNMAYTLYVTAIDRLNNRGTTKQDAAMTQECAPVDTTLPGPVTNLGYRGDNTYIWWNWTNPSDADFDHTEVFLNGAPVTTFSKSTMPVFRGGPFSPTAPQKIEVITVDTAGNRRVPGESRTDAATPGVY
jgi:hypothetical protein